MLYEIALVRPWNCAPGPSYGGGGERDAASVFLGLSAFSYAFGGHGLYPEEMREMRTPSAWPSVMHWTYGLTMPLYWLCGALGYFAYGDYSLANINLNFPRNPANTLSIVVQLVQEVYFIVSTNLVMNLAMELAFGIDPVACCKSPTTVNILASGRAPRVLSGTCISLAPALGLVKAHADLTEEGTRDPARRIAHSVSDVPVASRLPPWLQRLLLRTAFFTSQVLVAQTLLSGEGDTLIALQSLIGAVGMTAFTYFMPYVLLMLLTPTPLSRVRLCWFSFNIAMGVVVMLGGLASSMDDLISSSAGVFAGECTLSYAYAPTSPDDPCFESGLRLAPWSTVNET
mmetsp:Transcript_27573/g.83952  ORF Transcript_27573/g.83952 Transcript_27573/m.83952 type:complete len:343 (+) Transcript_27573:851-1879(+)